MHPESQDYILSPCGPLGGHTAISEVNGRFYLECDSTERALAAIADRMEKEQWWSTVWWQSDHGNLWPIDLEGNEIKEA